jgi:hypothetical protein
MSPIRSIVPEAMMTTKFMPSGRGEVRTPWLPRHAEQNPVRMKWVVVTDHHGRRQLRSNWNPAPGA